MNANSAALPATAPGVSEYLCVRRLGSVRISVCEAFAVSPTIGRQSLSDGRASRQAADAFPSQFHGSIEAPGSSVSIWHPLDAPASRPLPREARERCPCTFRPTGQAVDFKQQIRILPAHRTGNPYTPRRIAPAAAPASPPDLPQPLETPHTPLPPPNLARPLLYPYPEAHHPVRGPTDMTTQPKILVIDDDETVRRPTSAPCNRSAARSKPPPPAKTPCASSPSAPSTSSSSTCGCPAWTAWRS